MRNGCLHPVPLLTRTACGERRNTDGAQPQECLLNSFGIFINKSGSHLLFHTVSSIVPSAVQVLTVVFGMRTGVTPARIATGQTYLFYLSHMTT